MPCPTICSGLAAPKSSPASLHEYRVVETGLTVEPQDDDWVGLRHPKRLSSCRPASEQDAPESFTMPTLPLSLRCPAEETRW
jgi:hypothetical protein